MTLQEASAPLMKFLSENHHPHTQVIVTGNTAELWESQEQVRDNKFLVD